MHKLLIPLLAAITFPTIVNAELTKDYFLKYSQAKTLLNQGNFTKAEKICDEMIEISPEGKWGYICKGSSIVLSGKRKKERL